MDNTQPDAAPTAAGLEVVNRLAGARAAIDAVLTGRWMAEPATLAAVERLLAASTRWARVADGEKAA